MSLRRKSETRECCYCPASENRCASNQCRCFTEGRKCNSACETVYLKSDCLNTSLCKCTCGSLSATAIGSNDKRHHPKPKKSNSTEISTPSPDYCNNPICQCFRYKEPCSEYCSCGFYCKNMENSTSYGILKKELVQQACLCSSSKKSCSKSEKCTCRQALSYCSPLTCKCCSNCSNAGQEMLSKTVCENFLDPTNQGASLIAILKADKRDHYMFEFSISYKDKQRHHPEKTFCDTFIDHISRHKIAKVEEITVLITRSPCFHQNCEPKCDIIEHCIAKKECAKLIAISYGKIKKHLMQTNLTMTIKFISPYISRGDLYTKQALLCLMEAGIQLAPLTMKDWITVMMKTDLRGQKIKELQNYNTTDLISLWTTTNMNRHVQDSQTYINQCRQAKNLKPIYWLSAQHDMIKEAAITSFYAKQQFDQLTAKAKDYNSQPADNNRSPGSKSKNSEESIFEELSKDNNTHGTNLPPTTTTNIKKSNSFPARIHNFTEKSKNAKAVHYSQSITQSFGPNSSLAQEDYDNDYNDLDMTSWTSAELHNESSLSLSKEKKKRFKFFGKSASMETSKSRSNVYEANQNTTENTRLQQLLLAISDCPFKSDDQEMVQDNVQCELLKIANQLDEILNMLDNITSNKQANRKPSLK